MTLLTLTDAQPDAPALSDQTSHRSRADLFERGRRIAGLLRHDLGVGPDEHVAMLMGNRVEFVELCLGALLAGVWMTPVNWHLAPAEIAHVLDDSGARAAFVDPGLAGRIRDVVGNPPAIPVIEVGAELDDRLSGVGPAPLDLGARPGGNMFYTSGTSGRPKGVKRARKPTLGEALEALCGAGHVLGLDGSGPHLVTGPLYHAAPLGFAVMDQHNGAEVVVMPRFDAVETLALIDELEVRHTHLVPTMFVRLLALPDEVRAGFDGSSLATVLHGAAPIAETVKRRMIEWWGPVLVEYWGGSEGGVVTLATAEEWLARPGTVGRPTPNHEVWAGDESARRLPAGEEGLLWCHNLSSELVFEYHRSAEKTSSAFAGPGVYTLGDLGRVDEDGYVHLSARRSDLIISGGVNIYPAEVEQVLQEHPAISDVAVFGIPDPEWGESVRAAVQPDPGCEGTADLEREILSWARERLASYKVPRSIDWHDHLPRSDNGKLYRRRLRDPYLASGGAG